MGRIAAPFGVKGWVKVQPFSEDPGALLDFESWRIGRGDRQRDYPVAESQEHGNALVARLEGITDRDQAYALRGLEISVPRSALPDTAHDEYYWADLIGLDVINRQGAMLGKVESLMETGAHDVLVVKGSREYLIPFIDAYVGAVDSEAGTIAVDWGEDY